MHWAREYILSAAPGSGIGGEGRLSPPPPKPHEVLMAAWEYTIGEKVRFVFPLPPPLPLYLLFVSCVLFVLFVIFYFRCFAFFCFFLVVSFVLFFLLFCAFSCVVVRKKEADTLITLLAMWRCDWTVLASTKRKFGMLTVFLLVEANTIAKRTVVTLSYSVDRYGMVQYDIHGMVWYGRVWYGMVWYDMVWYGMVWHGMVWYGMVWYGIA